MAFLGNPFTGNPFTVNYKLSSYEAQFDWYSDPYDAGCDADGATALSWAG